jgi:hypothetical protein
MSLDEGPCQLPKLPPLFPSRPRPKKKRALLPGRVCWKSGKPPPAEKEEQPLLTENDSTIPGKKFFQPGRVKDKKKPDSKPLKRAAKWKKLEAMKNRLDVGNNQSFDLWQMSSLGKIPPPVAENSAAMTTGEEEIADSDSNEVESGVAVDGGASTGNFPVDVFVTAEDKPIAGQSQKNEHRKMKEFIHRWAQANVHFSMNRISDLLNSLSSHTK